MYTGSVMFNTWDNNREMYTGLIDFDYKFTQATEEIYNIIGYYPCMAKSLLDQGFWLEFTELARHLHQKLKSNDEFTIHGQ